MRTLLRFFGFGMLILSLNFLLPVSLWAMAKKPHIENEEKPVDIPAQEKFGKAPDPRDAAKPPLGREIAVSEELEEKAWATV